jgi:RHS repeat-associated protein
MSGRQVAEFFYDENGNRRQSIDGLLRVTDLEYDPLNRVNKVLDALRPICPVGDANCGRTSTSYDALDQQTQVTDPKGLSTNYTFDGLGQLDALNSPDTGSTTYTQDQAGNRIRQVDSRGVRTDYDYDSLNRLRSITFPTGNAGRNSYFEYDTVNSECATTYRIGRLTRMVDSSGSTEYCYDHRGNVTRKRQRVVGRSDMTVAYTYSVADRLASTTLPGGTSVVYQRDQVGRISSITVNGSPLINSVAYYPWGPVRSLSYANGTSLTKTYDANYAITYIASSRPFEFHLDYTTDVTGNIKQIQDQDQIRQFQVDPLDRLTDVLSYGQTIDRYTYDAVGNRLSAQAGSVTEPYVYDGNRLSRVGGIKRGYDAAGNTTDISNVQQRFRSYDERNRLISAGGGGRNPNDYYDYNGRGERVIQYKDASGERGYLYDESGSILVFETDDLDQHRSIVYLDALPVAVVDPVGLYTIDTDHLGTPREIVNFANQAIVWQWELVTGGPIDGGGNAFGDRAPFEYWGADGNKFVFDMRFPGQIYDQTTGLNYNYFRDYEPGTGRYVESDPIGLEGGSSTYSYVYSSPTTMVDPEGLSAAIAIGRPMTGFGPRPLFNSPVDLDQPLPLTDNPALRPYKDPDGEFCKSLERRIENSKKEIFDKRYPDLATNPGGLPRRIGPGENLEDTVRGHEKLLNRRLRETRKLEDEYDQLCKPPVTFTLLCN